MSTHFLCHLFPPLTATFIDYHVVCIVSTVTYWYYAHAQNAVSLYVQTCTQQVGILEYAFALHSEVARHLHTIEFPIYYSRLDISKITIHPRLCIGGDTQI